MKKAFSIIVLALLGAIWAGAKVTLPSFFSDNMVLQQNTEASIWGWTDTNGKITISTTSAGSSTPPRPTRTENG